MAIEWLGDADHGSRGTPGSSCSKRFAGVRRTKNGQYELAVQTADGSNQGCLEWHDSDETRFRAASLEELLRIGVAETRNDHRFNAPEIVSAIRDAIFEAQDAEAD
jgi:hypothetical protein